MSAANSSPKKSVVDCILPSHRSHRVEQRTPKFPEKIHMSNKLSRLLPGVLFLMTTIVPGMTAQTTFTSETYATGPSASGVVSGDFNRDGKPDLAIADDQANRINILLGTGGGHFTFGASYNTGNSPLQVVTGDFNHDGNLDLIADNSDQSLTILFGNGDGTFRAGPKFTFSEDINEIVAGDWNHDGLPDLAAVTCHTNFPPVNCSLLVLRNTGGNFAIAQTIPVGSVPFRGGMISDDFNIDGSADLALSLDKNVQIYTNNGTGNFTLHTTVTPPAPYVVVDIFSS